MSHKYAAKRKLSMKDKNRKNEETIIEINRSQGSKEAYNRKKRKE
jgi:hypothetical protein